MGYDGTVTIGTFIDATGINKGIDKISNILNKRMSGLEKSVNQTSNFIKKAIIGGGIIFAVRAITKELGSAVERLDTMKNYVNVMSNLGIGSEDAEASIQRLNEALDGLPTTLDTAAMAVQRLTAANGNIKASTEMYLAMNNAILAGGASMQTQITAAEQLSQAYAKGKPDMMEWRTMMTAMPAQLTQVAKVMGFVNASELGESLRKGSTSMNEFMITMVKMNKQGINGYKSLEEQARNATGGIGTSLVNLKTAITRGLANIMDAIGRSNIVGFFNAIRNAIDKVIPYIQAFIKLMATAINYIAALFGRKAKAQTDETKKSVEGFSSSISGASNNMNEATGEAKKLNKQLKTLAAFDEMNVLQENKSSSSGDSSGTNDPSVGLGGIDLSAFDNLGEASNKLDEIYQKLLKIGTDLASRFDFENLVNSIKRLGNSMLDFVNGVGKLFSDFFNNYILPIAELRINFDLPKFFDITSDAISQIDFGVVAESFDVLYQALVRIDRPIVEGLLILWDVISNFAAIVITDVLPGFLEAIAGALDILSAVLEDVMPALQGLWDNFLKPIMKWTGDKIGKGLKALGDFLSAVAENEIAVDILEEIGIFIGTIAGALALYNAAIAIYNVATGIAAAVTGTFSAAIAFLASPIGMIVAAIAAVVAVVVLLIKHWDDVKAVAEMVWNKIKEIWGGVATWFNNTIIQPVKKFFSGMWDGLKSGASSAWNGIKSVFSTVASFFKNTFTNAWEGVKKVFSTGGKIFSGITEGILSGFKKIVNTIIDGINKIIKVPFDGINTALNKIRNISIAGQKPFKGLISTIKVPKIPKLAKGGIINQPGSGVAVGGERGKEGVIPLTDSQQMALLGEAIGKYITVNANITNTMNGRVISRELKKITNENDFAYNR